MHPFLHNGQYDYEIKIEGHIPDLRNIEHFVNVWHSPIMHIFSCNKYDMES